MASLKSHTGKQTGWPALSHPWQLKAYSLRTATLASSLLWGPIPIKEHQTEHEAASGFKPHQINAFSADAELSRKKKKNSTVSRGKREGRQSRGKISFIYHRITNLNFAFPFLDAACTLGIPGRFSRKEEEISDI